MKKKKLTPKQRLFIKHYLISLNATDAAKKAGYSKKTAYSMGQRLLKDVEIKAEIDKVTKKIEDKLDVSYERQVKEIADMAFAKIGDDVTIGSDGLLTLKPDAKLLSDIGISESIGKAGLAKSFRISQSAKLKALELLSKLTGTQNDRSGSGQNSNNWKDAVSKISGLAEKARKRRKGN